MGEASAYGRQGNGYPFWKCIPCNKEFRCGFDAIKLHAEDHVNRQTNWLCIAKYKETDPEHPNFDKYQPEQMTRINRLNSYRWNSFADAYSVEPPLRNEIQGKKILCFHCGKTFRWNNEQTLGSKLQTRTRLKQHEVVCGIRTVGKNKKEEKKKKRTRVKKASKA